MEANSQRSKPLLLDTFKEEWFEILKKLPEEGLKGKFAPVNILGTLAKSSEYFGPFLEWWIASKLHVKLDLRIQEMIILRIAYLKKADYVWGHNLPIAISAGFTEDEAKRLCLRRLDDQWQELDLAILQAVDELMQMCNISQELWQNLIRYLDEHQIVDIITLVSQYFMLASMNNSFGVRLELGMEGLPEDLP